MDHRRARGCVRSVCAWKRHAPDRRGRKLTKVNSDGGGISPKATVDLLVRRLSGTEDHDDTKPLLGRVHAQEHQSLGRTPSGFQPLPHLLLEGNALRPSPLRHLKFTEDGQDILPHGDGVAEPYPGYGALALFRRARTFRVSRATSCPV